MNIAEFFQQSAGRWSSIKSNHHVDTTQQQSGRSTIEMELLDANNPAVAELCSKQGLNVSGVAAAAQVKWDGTMEGITKKDSGSSLLVAIGTPEQGQLLRTIGNFGTAAPSGTYRFGDGGEFMLTVEDKDFVTSERIWFESENVRMRHTKVQYPNGKSIVSFCSEVRLMTSKS
ncbi:phycobiliprotein lyase [filamentous cyanobacterium LEGE 11480]|uniref:Chromophore lyase CpcS/CpeS n=1 Tax=Romeriopsis navalis LEGE 11480 TaxID=2777977 RepID=A0A928VN34_9CYAN|nr:phycobiliprotein lyase [Romeriopsis navalis]MBE9031581.1 phycobiliprotein lyase [Romeriopsis navalis LEGE 11480]